MRSTLHLSLGVLYYHRKRSLIGHNPFRLYEKMGDEAFTFYAKALAPGE
jgi:hypothetical protein